MTCEQCGSPFYRRKKGSPEHDSRRFCGRKCTGAHLRDVAARKRAAKPVVIAPVKRCVVCSNVVSGQGFTCSTECRKQRNRVATSTAYRARHPIVVRTCDNCGTLCESAKKKRRVFCSPECLRRFCKRVEKAKRRARLRGAPSERIDPIKVFERDGWRCVYCGCATPKELRGQAVDAAPEMDHIVPLSRGGSHTWANVTCSCRKCNNRKRDKQLAATFPATPGGSSSLPPQPPNRDRKSVV